MDAAEFKQQFLPYHRKLYRTAFRLTENPQEAEDMVQEAYLKLWNKRDELADVLNTEAYCVTLIKNLCYDVLRRSQPDEDGRPPEELNLPTDTNIAREVEQRDEVNQVRRLIGRLPEQQKRVILLVDGGDATYLCHWMRESGLAALLPSLTETVWVGVSAGSMVMTPRIGADFVAWRSAPNDKTLGKVDFSIFPHLDHPMMPGTTLADAERWAADIAGPAYAMDDETALKVVDGVVEVVSEGHWKQFG